MESKQKKQTAFEKSKEELSAVSLEIDSVKLKLFGILQGSTDDTEFSNWAKKRISRNVNSAKNENANPVKPEKGSSTKPANTYRVKSKSAAVCRTQAWNCYASTVVVKNP